MNHRDNRTRGLLTIILGFMLVIPFVAHATSQIELNRTLHFSNPEGESIELEPGLYDLSHPGGDALEFSQAKKKALTIPAQKGTHTEALTQPEALLSGDEEDSTLVRVMLLLPDGTGWEALGSTTGIKSRGKFRLLKRKRNLSRILRYKKRPQAQKPRIKLKRKTPSGTSKPRPKVRIPKRKRPLTPLPGKGPKRLSLPDGLLVKLRPGKSIPPNVMQELGLRKEDRTASGATLFRLKKELESAGADDLMEIAKKLVKLGSVVYAQPNYIKQHTGVPNDDLFPQQWHYFENGTGPSQSPGGIGLPTAWDTTRGKRSIVVAVLDTGIVRNHSEVMGSGNILPGYDMIEDPVRAKDGNGRDPDPTDPGDSAKKGDCGPKARSDSWHGTHVAGTIGIGKTNNRAGVSGVNWEVKVLPVRVMGKCGGTTKDINAGIRWAAGLPVPGVPPNPNPARIINMSLSVGDANNPRPCFLDQDTQKVINQVVSQKGAIVVVSAGNKKVDASLLTPASCKNVVTVAASDARGHLATRYSNFGPLVDIMAPGGDRERDDNFDGQPDGVLSLYHPELRFPATASIPRGFALFQGTSMATPHVSGVLALWLSIDPTLTNAELRQGLRDNALPRNFTQCPRPCGAGLLNANNRSFIQPKRPIPPTPIQPTPPGKSCAIRTSDIVGSMKIDIGDNDSQGTSAKQALLRMLSRGDLQTRREASGMVKATESGALAGIFQASKGPVADRGKRMTPQRGWWTFIPQGQLGMCLKEPAGEPPMIIYRNKDMHPSVLDDTLKKAWRQCGLPTPDPPCEYIRDMGNKPRPPITPSGSGLTVFALEGNKPLQRVVITVTGKVSGGVKFTDVEGAADFDALTPGSYTVKADGCGVGYSTNSRTIELAAGEQTSLSIPLIKGCSGKRSDCPPGTVPDPSGDFCIIPVPVTRPCTTAEIHQEFQRQTDFCASIKSGIDLNCSLGASPCDALPLAKLVCDLFEKGSGKSTKHSACDVPRATFYEQCVVSTVVGERPTMKCNPGSNSEILQKYRSWPGRVK